MELMFQPLKKYADFQGRARRSEYWLWFLFQILASLAFSILKNFAPTPVEIINGIFSLAILLPTIAVAVRRFHDINRTGWWVLFPLLVLIIALVVYISMDGTTFMNAMTAAAKLGPKPTPDESLAVLKDLAPMVWVFLAYLAAAIVTLVFNVLPGTAGRNKFGPDPKGGNADASVF